MANEMIGQKFGHLQVLALYGVKGTAQHKTYLCRCDCGVEKIIVGASIRAGRSQSCGCLSREKRFTSERVTTHGKSRSKTYQIWNDMKTRCSPAATGRAKKNYYDKGIRVCERWLKFENFFEDMGDRPEGMTIDRIDSNKNYEPHNCRWATPKEQANNMNTNHYVEFNGKRQTIAQWADELGLKHNTFAYRLYRTFLPQKHF